MKPGDKVRTLGDDWITPDSIGEILGIDGNTVSVRWLKVEAPDLYWKSQSFSGRAPKEGKSLMHRTNVLKVIESAVLNPNMAFKYRVESGR